MENPTTFDLNRAIQQWRYKLGQSPAFKNENLDELESHLCDSVERLQICGLSAEEGFTIAAARIGRSGSLENEFAKVNTQTVWLDRVLWMLIGIQVWGFVSGFVISICNSAVSLGLLGSNFDFAAHGRTIPVVLFTLVRLLAIAGSLALCVWLIVRKGQTLGLRMGKCLHRPAMLAAICGVLWLASLAGMGFSYGSTLLLLRFGDLKTFGEVNIAMNYSSGFTWAIQVGVLISLTLILARRRLHMSRA